MSKQLNVNLAFQANTSQAKQAIMDLQSSLSKVATMKMDVKGIDPSKIKEASNAAKELSVHLNNAFNAKTGNFDLSKLDQSLKTSGTNVTQLSTKLLSAGATGEQAFVKLAQSIAAADRPLVTLGSKMNGFLTVLKNTARWQISSSILHGFIGSIQSAYGYAKDLNESLNNIRIVTGQTTDQMARFAEQANRAAKNLSTTTTAYTDAALIFYQQGLKGDAVTDRADVVIKMANASGQSAEIVSDQLTAIWNNFYDGSDSLESYADKITALGAATASSSEEISQGLEKFASVAETVGLSYEYATAALATVTATTRQSADVVGTAFKTLFARLNDLKLGETLDDGTTLGQYTENLAKVGVNIKDASGQLKDMDVILEETAAKWKELDKDQQVALAKGVAGIRQYNQFIALMSNWDFMEENLETVKNSEGVLQDQADTYAESWAASSKRVKASLESIYSQLLDDDFFIDVNNGFSSLLDSVGAFIDGLGGVKTIVLYIGSLLLNSFAGKIQPALQNLGHTFRVVFSTAQQQADMLTQEMNKGIEQTLNSDQAKNFSQSSLTALENAKQMNIAKGKLQSVEKTLNSVEQQRYELELSLLQADQESLQVLADKVTKRKEEIDLLQQAFNYDAASKDLSSQRGTEEEALIANKKTAEQNYLNDPSADNSQALENATKQLDEHRAATERLTNAREQYAKSLYEAYTKEMEVTNGSIEKSTEAKNIQELMPEVVQRYSNKLNQLKEHGTFEKQRTEFAKIKKELELITKDSCPALQKALDKAFSSKTSKEMTNRLGNVIDVLKSGKIPAKDLEKILSKLGQGTNINNLKNSYRDLNKDTTALTKAQEQLNAAIKGFNPTHTVSSIEQISKAAAGLGQTAMAISSIRSLLSAWNNDDLSIGEKLTTSMMSLSMIFPAVTGAIKSFSSALQIANTVEMAKVIRAQQLFAIESQELVTMKAKEIAKKKDISLEEAILVKKKALAVVKMQELGLSKAQVASMTAEQIAEQCGIGLKEAQLIKENALTVSKGSGIMATIAQTAANWALNTSMSPLLAVCLALAAAILGIAAAAALVVVGIKALINWYNKDAIAAEKAAKAAKEAADEHKRIQEELDKLKSKFSVYDDAVAALEKCTKGTQEWEEALKNVNDSVLDLLNEFPELLKQKDLFTRDDNGMFVIDESKRADILELKQQAVNAAQASSLLSSAEALRTAAVSEKTSLSRTISSEMGVGEYHEGGQNSTGRYDDTIDLQKILMDNVSNLAGLSKEEYGQKVREMVEQEANDTAKSYSNFSTQVDSIVKVSEKYYNSIQDLANNTEEAATALENATKIIVDNNLSEEYDSAEKKLAGRAFENREKELKDAWLNLMTSNGGSERARSAAKTLGLHEDYGYEGIAQNSGASNEIYKEVARQLEEAGTGYRAATGNTVLGSDTNRRFIFEDSKGERTEEKSAEWVAQQLAAAQALKELSGSAEAAGTALTEMDTKIKERSKNVASNSVQEEALRGFIANEDFSGTNAGDFKDFYREVAQYNPEGVSTGSVSETDAAWYVDAMFGDGEDGSIRDETAQKYGYDTADEMIKAFHEKLSNMNEEWEKIDLPSDLIGVDKLSLEASQKLQATFDKMNIGPMGKKAGRIFKSGMNEMIKSLSSDDQTAALEQLGSINWSDWDAIEQADAIMKQFGIDIDTGSEEWKKFANEMRKANLAIPDYSKLKTNLQDISKILDSLDFGSVISDEDYQKLVAYNDEWERFFILQADGSRKFIGNAEEMKQATLDSIAAQSKDLAHRKEISDGIAKSIENKDFDLGLDVKKIDALVGGDGLDGSVSEATLTTYNNTHDTDYENSDDLINNVFADESEKILNDDNIKTLLKDAGYDDKKLEKILESARNGNREELETVLGYVQDFMETDWDTADDEIKQMYASSASSIEELNALLDQGLLGEKTGTSAEETPYEKQVKNLTTSAIMAAESLDDLNQAWQEGLNTGVELNYGVYIEKLRELASQYSICTDNVRDFNLALQSLSGEYDGSVDKLNSDLEWNKELLDRYKTEFNEWTQEQRDSYNQQLKDSISEDDIKEVFGEGKKLENLSEEDTNKVLDNMYGAHDFDSMVEQTLAETEAKIEEQEKLLAAYNEAQAELEASIMLGEAAEKYGLDMDELNIQAQQLQKEFAALGDEYKLTGKQAANLAIQNQRMNKGVASLVDNWEDWGKALKTNKKTSQDWAKAAAACTKTIADLIGASEDLELPADFFESEENMALLERAAEGDAKAIDLLGISVAQSQVAMMKWSAGMKTFAEDGSLIELDETGFETAVGHVQAGLTALQNQINTLGLEPGTDVYSLLGGDDWVNSLNDLAAATGMTKDQMNDLLNEVGVQAEVEMKTQKQEMEVPTYTEVMEPNEVTVYGTDSAGNEIQETRHGWSKYTVPGEPKKVEGYVQVAQIKATGNDDVGPPEVKFTGNGSISNSAQQGSNGSKSTSKGKESRKKKTDVVDRYKEVNDSLEKTNRLMQKNSTLAEGMWGKDKINMMKQNVNLMKQENELLEDKLDLANEYLAEDKAELEATGIGFTFDESGAITNYTTQMESLFAAYDAQLDAYGGDDADLSEDQKEVLDNMWEHIETVKAAYEKYEGTLDEVQDLQQEQLEKQLEIQQQNFDILNETLEANLAFEEHQLSYIEHKLNMISDNFYQMAEGIALMIGSLDENGNIDISGSQFDMYQSNYSTYKNQKEDLDKSYAQYLASGGKDGINQDLYIQGLEDLSSRVMENVENMKALDDAMFTYYGETLAAASEKLSRFTALQEHNVSVLDHMQTTMELLGKASDPKNLSSIINAQAKVALDNLQTSEEWYDKMKAQADARKKEYDDKYAELMKDGNMSQEDWEALAWYEEQWLSAQEVANEAEDKMYSDFETWLQKTKDATKNAVDVANKEWEKSLITSMFGKQNPFKSFDDLTLALDRQKSLQEDILTTTNKKYETDKLIRQVQQDIDKSTNSVAKKELKAFIERTQEKQNQNKLSETELGILQQEYELLQAKIALEEAQNAKSTVRLQRDSEGNFGYVYTADQDKVADAEQAYADAENTLYNVRLDAANEYSEKYIQTMSEMHATLSELEEQNYNGEFASLEEYQNAVTAATDYYYAQLEQYQDIYHNIFKDNASWTNDFVGGESGDLRETVTDDVTLMKESMIGQMGLANTNWCSNFDTIDTRTSTWKTKTDGYTDDVEGYFSDMEKTIGEKITTSGNHFSAYQSLVNTETGELNGDLKSIQTETQNIISKNEALTKSLTDPKIGLIKGLDDEVNAVGRVVTAYGPFKQAIDDAIKKQSKLLELLNQELSLQYTENAPENEDTSSSDNNNNNNNNNSDSNNNSGNNNNSQFGSATWERGKAVYDLINRGQLGNGYNNRVAAGANLGYSEDEVRLGQYIIDYVYPTYLKGMGYSWEYTRQLLGFDTGGYTGSWNGGYGKMALLHEKELVLNARDTENFLASMELLNSIVKTIDLYSMNAQLGGMLSTPTFGSYGSEPLEQNVHIEASFPGVTDKNQIEEAFNDIINLASQYANRK